MLYLATYKGLNLIILAFALKQPTPAPVYAPKIPAEPEIDPEELEKIFSGALPIAVPQQMVKPYSLEDFFKRKAPPNQDEVNTASTEPPRDPQTHAERELLLKTDIEKFRQYAKDKRFENLDDEDLTNYFAINIAENFRFDLSLLSNFVKSEKYLKLSSQDPAAEKYYMRATALLKNYFEDTWGRTLPDTSPAPIIAPPTPVTPPAKEPKPAPPLAPAVQTPRAPTQAPPPPPNTQGGLPKLGEPAFTNPKEQEFHERTRALRKTHGGRSVKDLTWEEKLPLLARLTAEHYGFDPQKIKDALKEIETVAQKADKEVSREEMAYAQEAIRLIETEILDLAPRMNTASSTAVTNESPASISPQPPSPLAQFLQELTRDFARGKYNASQFYAADEAIKKASAAPNPMEVLKEASKNPLLQKLFSPELLANLSAKITTQTPPLSGKKESAYQPAVSPQIKAKELPTAKNPSSVTKTAPTPKTDQSTEEYLIWTACEKQLTARFRELFATMNEAQKMHVVSAARDRIRIEAKKRNITLSPLDISSIIVPIIGNQNELLAIINDAERSYAIALKNFAAINEALANWVKAHPKEKITEDEVSSIIFALPPLKASSAPLKMERVLLTQGANDKEAQPELMLSNKENLLRLICNISAPDYMTIQKAKLKDLYAKRKPERLIKLADGYGLRDSEAGHLTLRQFINKEIGFL